MNWFQELSRVMVWSLVILTVWTSVCLAATDKTLEEKAVGKDVVESVVAKIRRSNIFPEDYELLRRLAYVETHDGESNTTFSGNNYGGIWNLPEIYFNHTKNQTNSNYHAAVNSKFGIDWIKVAWTDLLKPLYSGLAARLYLAYLNLPIPQTIAEQGHYYERHYSRKDEKTNATFVNATEELDKSTPVCSGRMDLVIVLDGSSSVNLVNPKSFEICKRFVVDLIGSFSIKTVRHGFIVYSSEVFPVFPLDNFLTLEQLTNKTMSVPYPDAKTNTNAAILAAVEMFEDAEPRPGVPQVLTIFTDGKSNPTGVDNIGRAKEANISSYAIGITNEVDLSELEQLAYNINSHVFALNNFEILAEFFKRLNAETCKIPQKPQLGDSVADTLSQGERRYYEIGVPSEGAALIVVDVVEGQTTGYYSFSEENPSPAINDGVLTTGETRVQPPITLSAVDGMTSVFIAVEGLKPFNNYTIEIQATDRIDDNLESTTDGARATLSVSFSILFVTLVSFIFKL